MLIEEGFSFLVRTSPMTSYHLLLAHSLRKQDV
jgi:hypothetical protein